jgi:hypothetical protein
MYRFGIKYYKRLDFAHKKSKLEKNVLKLRVAG